MNPPNRLCGDILGPRQPPLSSLRRKPLHGGSPECQAPMAAGTGRVLPPGPWGHGDIQIPVARRDGPVLPGPHSAVPGGWQGHESVLQPVPQFPLFAAGREPLGDTSGAGPPEPAKGQLPPPALLSLSPQHHPECSGETLWGAGGLRVLTKREGNKNRRHISAEKLSFFRTGLTAEGGTGLLQPQSLA